MRPKRLISLLVAVCMMITMLPLSAVTAFAEDTSTKGEAIVDGYKYAYTVDAHGNATITEFRGPVDPANDGPYDIEIPTELNGHPVWEKVHFPPIISTPHCTTFIIPKFSPSQFQKASLPSVGLPL